MAKKESKRKNQVDISKIEARQIVASCVCGATFDVMTTLKELRVDICSACHPFFTGESRILDAEGRIEKFRKKYQLADKK